MGDLATRGLRQSDGSNISCSFHIRKSQTLVNRNLDSAIPDFPKWEISRHVASVNQTAQIYPGVSTLENPELLSTGIPIPDAIPDFPKWEISRHVASVNQMAQIYFGVSTLEIPDPLGC
jgi:hypothetical protein